MNSVHAPSLTDIQALAERLEGLGGADRPTDALIAQAIDKPTGTLNGMSFDEAVERFPHDLAGIATHWPVDKFTGSLDAALALVERVLSDCDWSLCKDPIAAPDGPYWAHVTIKGLLGTTISLPGGEAPTAPFALLRALVAAKIEEAKNG